MKRTGKKIAVGFGSFLAVMLLMIMMSITALAAGTATVSVDSAKVRSSASTNSDVVATAAKGATLTIESEESDASGTVWYKVTTSDGKTGYVRSDLVTKNEDAAEETADDTAEQSMDAPAAISSGAGPAIPDGVTAQDAQYATTTSETTKVRSDASTNDGVVTMLDSGSTVTIYGSKSGSDTKTWYFVELSDGKTGYIRSDLVSLGDYVPAPEPVAEEPVEAAAEEPEESQPIIPNDYEAVYAQDADGNYVWYLYDHINNNRLKIDELLAVVQSQGQENEASDSQGKLLRIIVIVLAILLVAAIAVITILLLKRGSDDDYDDFDSYSDRKATAPRRRFGYRDDDDEDDDDDDDDYDDGYRPRRAQRPAQERPQTRTRGEEPRTARPASGTRSGQPASRSGQPARSGAAPSRGTRPQGAPARSTGDASRRSAAKAPRREVEYDPSRDEAQEQIRRSNTARKSRNFALDDDDDGMEFGFLNLDDNGRK